MTEMINIPRAKLILRVNTSLKSWGLVRLFVAGGLSLFFAVLYINAGNRHSILKQQVSVKQALRSSSVPKLETFHICEKALCNFCWKPKVELSFARCLSQMDPI